MPQTHRSPVEVRLVLQGGGAKLYPLFGALAAVQELESQGVVKIVAVAGTSAGAIAGALLAARVPMEKIRDWLHNSDAAKKLANPVVRAKQMAPVKKVWLAYRKKPLISERVLMEALEGMFKVGDLDLHSLKIGSFKSHTTMIPFFSTYTDLRNSCLGRHDDSIYLANALCDSAGLPFVVRPASVNNDKVDGGICENLPVIFFEHNGPPVGAISFQPVMPSAIDHPLRYALALISTAIDHSVERARSFLGSQNVCSLKTRLELLDFDKYLGVRQSPEMLDEWDKSYGAAKIWLIDFARRHRLRGQMLGDPWKEIRSQPSYWGRQYLGIMENLGALYKNHFASAKQNIDSIKFCVSLSLNGGANLDACHIKYIKSFSVPSGQSIVASRVTLWAPESAEIDEMEHYLKASQGAPDIMELPVDDGKDIAKDGDVTRCVVMWSTPPLTSNNGMVELCLETKGKGLMPRLSGGGMEEVFVSTLDAHDSVRLIDIYIAVPLSEINFLKIESNGVKDYSLKNFMTAQSASELAESAGLSINPTDGLVHWRAEKVPAGRLTGVKIKVEKVDERRRTYA